MRVRFLRNWDFRPPEDRRSTVAYKAGGEYVVRKVAGDEAIAAGAAELIDAGPVDAVAGQIEDSLHNYETVLAGSRKRTRRAKAED